MNTKEWAEKLNGREHRNEITREEERQAKEDGIVIVYGASDDLMEFGGAIHDELGAYDGGIALVSPEGLFSIDKECPEGGRYTFDDCHYLRDKRGSCVPIEAVWAPESMDGASWLMEAPEHLPHEHFDIMEDGALYCRGLVFRLAEAVKPKTDKELLETYENSGALHDRIAALEVKLAARDKLILEAREALESAREYIQGFQTGPAEDGGAVAAIEAVLASMKEGQGVA